MEDSVTQEKITLTISDSARLSDEWSESIEKIVSIYDTKYPTFKKILRSKECKKLYQETVDAVIVAFILSAIDQYTMTTSEAQKKSADKTICFASKILAKCNRDITCLIEANVVEYFGGFDNISISSDFVKNVEDLFKDVLVINTPVDSNSPNRSAAISFINHHLFHCLYNFPSFVQQIVESIEDNKHLISSAGMEYTFPEIVRGVLIASSKFQNEPFTSSTIKLPIGNLDESVIAAAIMKLKVLKILNESMLSTGNTTSYYLAVPYIKFSV